VVEGFFELRAILQDSAIDRGMIDGHAALLHEFFYMAIAHV
jgi:hypothetical protein